MIRPLMLGTALATVLTMGALAQDTSSSSSQAATASSSATDNNSSSAATDTASSAATDTASSAATDTASSAAASQQSTTRSTTAASRSPVDITAGYTQVDTDRLASKIIGSPVYDGPAADSNNLGKINDLVLDQNGQVAAVVLGVGGFLGIAEKQVAVDFGALQWVVAADNTERFVLQTTKEQLTAAPDFKTVEDKPANGANGASSSAVEQTTSSSSSAM